MAGLWRDHAGEADSETLLAGTVGLWRDHAGGGSSDALTGAAPRALVVPSLASAMTGTDASDADCSAGSFPSPLTGTDDSVSQSAIVTGAAGAVPSSGPTGPATCWMTGEPITRAQD